MPEKSGQLIDDDELDELKGACGCCELDERMSKYMTPRPPARRSQGLTPLSGGFT